MCVVAPWHGPAEDMGETTISHQSAGTPLATPPPKWLESHAGHQSWIKVKNGHEQLGKGSEMKK